jgi:hypothetical protein
MPVIFRQGSTRVLSGVLRFATGTLTQVAGEAVYTPPGGGGGVPTTRLISTTLPLAGGGDLSADRTLTLSGWSGTTDGRLLYRSGTAVATATTSAPLSFTAGALAITQSDATHDGYLSATDWSVFSAKVGTTRTISTTAPLAGGGDLSVDRTLSIPAATAVANGYLSSTDWSTFNAKEPAITAGTTSQYWRGDKSWQTLDKSAVGLGNVENTALSTWAGSTNIDTVGTIATGTWQGTEVAVLYGGTGAATASGARTNLGVAIGTNVQAWSTKLDALAALGNGFAYQGGGVWGAAAPGDLAVSGASVQVTQARGLRETAGPTTLAMGAVADGALLRRSGTSIIGAAIGSVVQAYDAILAGVVALAGTTGIVVKSAASTFVTRTLTAGSGQVLVTNGDGVSGNPTVDIEAAFLSGQYAMTYIGTDGNTIYSTNTATSVNGTTYTPTGTNNLPEMVVAASTVSTVGPRTAQPIYTLSQGGTHRYQVVTGSTRTTVRWRMGLAVSVASFGTSLKPGTAVAMVVFDSDGGQTNSATNWYLLTYDGGGGSVTYVDTGVACAVSTAYEIELIPTSASVSARVRLTGGTWSSPVSSSTSLPSAASTACDCAFLSPTTNVSRTLSVRTMTMRKAY